MNPRIKALSKDVARATTGRLADALLPPATRLVVFSRGRTGSNFLVSLLQSHPQIRHHGEIVGQYQVQHDFVKRAINRLGAVRYVERAMRRVMAERVIGVKFLYYQLEQEYANQWQVPSLPSILPVLQERTDLHVIHIKRRNLLATLVSWKVAQQTQQWQRRASGPLAHGDAVYDQARVRLTYEECRDEFAQAERWQRFYDTAFTQHPFLSMDYEDLVADTPGESARALTLLGLTPRALSSPMRKQNPRPLSDVVENFGELRERFSGTPHADFFADG